MKPLNIILFGFFINIFTSCSGSDEADPWEGIEEGYTPHPLAENMPHNDVTAKELKLLDFKSIFDESPTDLKHLHYFLNGINDGMRSVELSVFVSDLRMNAFSLSDGTLILFDIHKNRLIQYNLNNHRFLDLATVGRGPGDLLFSRELYTNYDRLYIAMQGFRISVFNCQSDTCEYETTFETPFNNYSISTEDDQFYILGLAPFGREQNPDPGNTEQFAIHELDELGKVLNSFNPVYKHKAPIVREQMNSTGTVRFFPQHRLVTVSYTRFPFIYLYDSEGNFLNKYRLPEFKQGYYDYNETTRTGTHRAMDHSSVQTTKKITDDWLLITIRNLESRVNDRYIRYDYYSFHLPSRQMYLAGRDKSYPSDQSRMIYTTDDGLLLNQQGTLYWIPM
ncbi:hypothetical protein IQ255_29875 [Pleurocapsales cyanobacterium LEGE 10410]|nr:hypothetical protein [Pleurocapsales cyanobacterium LEGE 10410]